MLWGEPLAMIRPGIVISGSNGRVVPLLTVVLAGLLKNSFNGRNSPLRLKPPLIFAERTARLEAAPFQSSQNFDKK